MSSENQEWLSAASDNQYIDEQQLDVLLEQAELQHKLQRFHTVGAVLRQEKSIELPASFADDIVAKLADEPVYKLQQTSNLVTKVDPKAKAANSGWFQAVAQGAIAAGVALMAVFGVQQYQQSPTQDALLPLPVLQTLPVAGFATPVSLSQTTVSSRFEQQEQQAMLEQQKRLQALLNAHRQQVRSMEQQQQASNQKPTKVVENEQ
ncbi:sigma-E factor negative regulatory protein [Rheinheimera salexigens]|uniref:Anti-sigma-E factor RseA n=1 Tax=Rheinheimera salexigens TaxID=1628148 RepID=A0A1E7Q4N8_9GAMM|nr:RseA family anti-sigma factor [Rheinheimera salexigens]OEY69119.1 anti-anti-sigma factor [Rheinheimera salexigens]